MDAVVSVHCFLASFLSPFLAQLSYAAFKQAHNLLVEFPYSGSFSSSSRYLPPFLAQLSYAAFKGGFYLNLLKVIGVLFISSSTPTSTLMLE